MRARRRVVEQADAAGGQEAIATKRKPPSSGLRTVIGDGVAASVARY
jgi:hypothetical protein